MKIKCNRASVASEKIFQEDNANMCLSNLVFLNSPVNFSSPQFSRKYAWFSSPLVFSRTQTASMLQWSRRPWPHPGCTLTWSPSCESLVAIRPVVCEKKRFAQKFTDRRTDGQTDDGRLAIALAHSWNELIIIMIMVRGLRSFESSIFYSNSNRPSDSIRFERDWPIRKFSNLARRKLSPQSINSYL